MNADLIVLGPGSLYTSVVPNLLVDGVQEAMRWSRAATVYVCNVATQHGETDQMGYEDHIRQIIKYLGDASLQYSVVHTSDSQASPIRPEWLVDTVDYDGKDSVDGVQIIASDVVSDKNVLRHDPAKLADVLIGIARRHKAAGFPLESSESA